MGFCPCSGWAQGRTELTVNMAAEGQSSNCLGENVLPFMGGPQFNRFVVPEVRAADVELVPVSRLPTRHPLSFMK